MDNLLPTGFPPTDNIYKFFALGGIILMLVPGIFLTEIINDLEQKQYELSQKMGKEGLEMKWFGEDVQELQNAINEPDPYIMHVVNFIVKSIRKSPFSTKIPKTLINELEEIESEFSNPINTLTAWSYLEVLQKKLETLEELNLSPQKDYEKLMGNVHDLFFTGIVESLKKSRGEMDENKKKIQIQRQHEILAKENSITIKQHGRLIQKINLFSRGLMICFWSGLVWALWGFYNWYIKIQRPQDLWLKAKGDLEKS